MISSTQSPSVPEMMVGMGQVTASRAPARLKAVLGSCIGLTLYHPRIRAGVMAHIVLPKSEGRTGAPGKFADQALPHMLRALSELGVSGHGLIAKLAGGANMFRGSGPLQIGDANIQAVTEVLERARIRTVGMDVGGVKGRRIVFDCTTGELIVERAGHSALRL